MKHRIVFVALLASTSFLSAPSPTSSIITFFIHELPFNAPTKPTEVQETTLRPGELANQIAHSLLIKANKGIFVTYAGYLVISNINGQISFPRMQQKEDFTLIITEHINPVLMIGNTIHHWEIPKIPAATYAISKKQDETTKLFYWDVQPRANPENNIIPLNSIVIFANPKNIIVPAGVTLSNDNSQLILPPVYIVKNSSNVIPALEALKVRQFFGTLHLENKKENATYYSSQMTTTQ